MTIFRDVKFPKVVLWEVTSLKNRIMSHCSGVISVANACGDCTDRAWSAQSADSSVTGCVCLTVL